MKLYLIYAKIPESEFNKTIKYLIPNVYDYRWINEKFYGLYAWTKSKSKLNDFLEVRYKKAFEVSKKNIDDDEYQMFKDHYNLLELVRHIYKYGNKKKEIEVVTTKNEEIESIGNGSENYNDFGPRVHPDANYRLFKDDIIHALDMIGYTSAYDLCYGNMEEADNASFNMSYNIGSMGSTIACKPSELELLVYLFYYTFYGNSMRKDDTT